MTTTVTSHRASSRLAALRGAVVRLTASAAVTVATAVSGVALVPTPAHADWVRADQWQLNALAAESAWRFSIGTGMVVAVLDSGVDATHPDLVGQVLPGADFVDGSTDGRVDPVGHGTTVAGLIAGRGDDDAGVIGLAPGAKILPVRVLDARNRYEDAEAVARGVRWAVDQGVAVINLSLGGPARSEALAGALEYAAANNVVVIACTGNAAGGAPPTADVWYPAREPGVIAVAGLTAGSGVADPTDGAAIANGGVGGGGQEPLWSGSLTGPQTVLTAPAVNLLGARPGGYWKVQGTSFAAPLVAASAALIRARWPQLSAANVVNRLIRTARDLGPVGRDDRYGFGSVDPVAALRVELSEVSANPLGRNSIAFPEPSDGIQGKDPVSGGGPPNAVPDLAAGPPSGAARVAGGRTPADRLRFSLGVGGLVFALLSVGGVVVYRRRPGPVRQL